MDIKRVNRSLFFKQLKQPLHPTRDRQLFPQPLNPTLLSVLWFTEYVIGASTTFSQFGAHQKPAAEFHLPQMILDAGKIFVAEFFVEHCEKRSKALRLKFTCMFIANIP